MNTCKHCGVEIEVDPRYDVWVDVVYGETTCFDAGEDGEFLHAPNKQGADDGT